MDINPARVDPPPIPLIKETYTGKSDGYNVKIKLCIYTTSITLDLYEFRMSLFDHGETEELLLFIRKFQMTLVATGMLETEAKVQYICTLVRGEALHQFHLLSSDVENTNTSLNVDDLLKGLAWYFSC